MSVAGQDHRNIGVPSPQIASAAAARLVPSSTTSTPFGAPAVAALKRVDDRLPGGAGFVDHADPNGRCPSGRGSPSPGAP